MPAWSNDLLRSGERLLSSPELDAYVADLTPPPVYLVLVSRAWRRVGTTITCQLFVIGPRDVLPCIPIPLREDEDDVKLDLQWVFNQAYDRGPYRRGAVDYGKEADPPLSPSDTPWLHQRLREHMLRP
jgi:hypothetical protein